MYSQQLLKQFTVIGGIVSLIQAAVWTLCSALGIAFSACSIGEAQGIGVTFGNFLAVYIQGKNCKLDLPGVLGLLTPTDIRIVLWFYLVTSLFWLSASFLLLSAFLQGVPKYDLRVLYGWIVTTAVMCLIDFVMTIMFGLDYNTLMELSSVTTMDNGITAAMTVTAVMMALAAKGFILWIINVLFLLYFCRVAYLLREEQKPPRQYPRGFGQDHDQWSTEEEFPHTYGQQPVSWHRKPVHQNPQFLEPRVRPLATVNRVPFVQNENVSRPASVSRSTFELPRIALAVPAPQVPRLFRESDDRSSQQLGRY